MGIDNNNTFDNNGHGNDFIADVSGSNDVGVNLEFIGETYEIMEGVMFEKGTKSWLPTDEWEKIKNEMTDWVVI